MRVRTEYTFLEKIQKRTLKGLIGLIGISYIIGWSFGDGLWFFSFIIRILFSIDLASKIFLIIIGTLLFFSEIMRYKKYKFLKWIPISILISAFVSGITLSTFLNPVMAQKPETFNRFFDLLSLFMYWHFGKAILNGLVEMEKVRLKPIVMNLIDVGSWIFYFVLFFFNFL